MLKKKEEEEISFSLGSAGLACLRTEITYCTAARIRLQT